MEAKLLNDLPDVRTGQGFDVHAFGEGDHVWLGGVKVPHNRGLVGHSDADVLLHAITDAVLGAIAEGDIGSHFPPSDPQWRGAASDLFLRHAIGLCRAGRPRRPYRRHPDLRETPSWTAPRRHPRKNCRDHEIAIGPRAVKATTSERLGFTGREEGIAALAMATVRLP